jgi:S-disulfanyl-L-cysteine oxidoreductase SoxD
MNKRLLLAGLAVVAVLAMVAAAQPSRSVWDGVYTADQAKRGADLYADQCSACHGLALNGGEMAPPLSGGEFMSNWNGLTVGDLFDRIRTTMPADSPGTLGRDKTADILAHILSANQFPAGSMELSRQSEVLKDIRFEATKPEKK